MPRILRSFFLGILLAGAAPTMLAAQDRGEELWKRVDSLLAHPHSLRLFLDSLARRHPAERSLECPMPVARVRSGAALRLTPPPDTARTSSRPVPMPTVPPGCVNPLFRRP